MKRDGESILEIDRVGFRNSKRCERSIQRRYQRITISQCGMIHAVYTPPFFPLFGP